MKLTISGRDNILRALIENGADINAVNLYTNDSALIFAIDSGEYHVERVQ